jgi:hypothetical protein
MNTMGSIGSFASSVSFPYLLRASGDARVFLLMAAVLNAGALISWSRLKGTAPQPLG